MQPIPVHAAHAIAERYDYDQIIIIARKVGPGGVEHVTTYGQGPLHKDIAARIGEYLKFQVMNWVPADTTTYEG